MVPNGMVRTGTYWKRAHMYVRTYVRTRILPKMVPLVATIMVDVYGILDQKRQYTCTYSSTIGIHHAYMFTLWYHGTIPFGTMVGTRVPLVHV